MADTGTYTELLLNQLTYLLNYSIQHSPSWEANQFLASQEISYILWNPKFIAALTRARHLSLSWASSIQSIPPHPTSWRSIFMLSSHLRLGLPSGLFPSDFPPPKPCTRLSLAPYALRAPPISFLSIISPALTYFHVKEI